MTLRKVLMVPILISLAAVVSYSDSISHSIRLLQQNTNISVSVVIFAVAAVVLQLVGHIVRARRMQCLIAPVKQGTVRFQFRALSIGYLFNVLLPLKLGELVRAKLIAEGERISFGFALTMVIIERLFDAIILVLTGLVLVAFGIVDFDAVWALLAALCVFIAVATISIVAAWKQSPGLLMVWSRFTNAFNRELRNSLRFRAWSIIYGLQRVVKSNRIRNYMLLTLASWTIYLLSTVLIVMAVAPHINGLNMVTRAVAPYFGMSVPAGPANLGAFSRVSDAFSSEVAMSPEQEVVTNLSLWAVLVIPTSVIGIVLLLWKTKEPVRRNLPNGSSEESLSDKLSRKENITPEMENFLESYFSGNSLSHIVHRLELEDNFRLLKYFKGGSDAITILAKQNGTRVVKKIIPIEFADRLQAQYDWLLNRKGKFGIVRPLAERLTKDHYSIDLEYDPRNEMYFEYMHHSVFSESKKVIDAAWKGLHQSIYRTTMPVYDPDAVEQYMQKHIFGCMEKACTVNSDLTQASESKTIIINGKQYHNFYEIMKMIRGNKQAMKDLATYSRSDEVHGDFAVDNILVSRDTRRPLLIDPAPDGNIIVGPVFDFGKNMQSLYCGYEFIVRSNDTVQLQEDGSIEYYNRRSVPYMELCEYVAHDLSAKYLTEAERRAMIFHAGALLIRRLKHQVYQAPGLTLAIYGAGIVALNDFLDQYNTTMTSKQSST